MKKIFSVLVAVVSAVTLMAQSLPTACEAQVDFKFCFPTTGQDQKTICKDDYTNGQYVWNNATWLLSEISTYPATIQKEGHIDNVRGCDSTVTMNLTTIAAPQGAAGGNNAKLFSVSATKKVYFSQGNLQFRATADGSGTDLTRTCADGSQKYGEFRFAVNQYDFVGPGSTEQDQYSPKHAESNIFYEDPTSHNQVRCDRMNASATYPGWIDLFALASTGYVRSGSRINMTPYNLIAEHAYYNENYNYDNGDYILTFGWTKNENRYLNETYHDWGYYNPISNADNTPGLWRTLTQAEWTYLFDKRTDAHNKFGRATIYKDDGTTVVAIGMVLLPDEWNMPDGVNFATGYVSGSSSGDALSLFRDKVSWTTNTYTLSQWTKMEEAGAVFLPNSGAYYYKNRTSYAMGQQMFYFSSTLQCLSDNSKNMLNASILKFTVTNAANNISNPFPGVGSDQALYFGAVRLVCDKK
ncbi:MAG: hypothetical protein MJZ55_00020 [Paludibacteraceae bacterium]|nr:hypothetical protein [Paludibacteraceae bacterium]